MSRNDDSAHHGWWNTLTSTLGSTDAKPDQQPRAETGERYDEGQDQAGYDGPRQEDSVQEKERAVHDNSPAHDRENEDADLPRVGKSNGPMAFPESSTYAHGQSQPVEHVSTIYNLPHSVEARHHSEVSSSEVLRLRDREIADLKYEVQGLRAATSEWEHRFYGARRELDAAVNQLGHVNKLLEEEHRRCQGGDEELSKLRALLEDRTEEVKVAQAFMTTADKYSVAEVSQMVEHLNDEIYQCAMDFSDMVLEQGVKPMWQRSEREWGESLEAARHAFRRWNKSVIDRLEADLLRDDPDATLLECMVQYAFTARCHEIIRAFCPQEKVVDKYLCDLWEKIASSHETSIARNWLAITQEGTKAHGQPLDRAGLFKQLGSLITLSGREPPTPTWLEEFITPKLDNMDSKAAKVKEAISEGVLSVDVEILAHSRDLPFKPTEMRDAFEKPGKTRPVVESKGRDDQIICSTGLGIRRITRVRRVSDPSTMRRKREVILKTKVVMYSTLID